MLYSTDRNSSVNFGIKNQAVIFNDIKYYYLIKLLLYKEPKKFVSYYSIISINLIASIAYCLQSLFSCILIFKFDHRKLKKKTFTLSF